MSHSGLWPRWKRPKSWPDADFPPDTVFPRSQKSEQFHGVDPDLLRALFDHCGVGWRDRPSILGRDLMVASLAGPGEWPQRFSLPSLACIDVLKDAPSWERWEKWGKWQRLPKDDFEMCYTNIQRRLPGGTAVHLTSEPYPHEEVTWFMWCQIDIPRLRLGIWPERIDRRTVWPTDRGRYYAWLFREAAEAIREQGGRVEPRNGYGWRYWTDDMAPWADRMVQLRDAPKPIADLVKLSAVAAIGLHGCGYKYKEATEVWTPECGVEVGERDKDGRRKPDQYYRMVPGRRTMVHWYKYTTMRCALDVYLKALRHMAEGRKVVAIRLDDVRVAA